MEQDWAQMCYLSCLNCLFLDSVAQTAFAQQLNTMLTASWNTLGQELLQEFGTWLSGQHTEKKNGARKIKIWSEMQTLFFLFLSASPFQAQQNFVFFVSLFFNTSFYPCPPPPPQIKIALIGQKLNLFVMGKLSESWHTGVCTKMYIYWAVRTKQKPNCTLSKRGIRYFSNKSSAFLLLSNKSNSHWRNSCLSRRLSYKLAK